MMQTNILLKKLKMRSVEPKFYDSSKMFGASKEVAIEHKGESYTLKINEENKLELTE